MTSEAPRLNGEALAEKLRLVVITDPYLASPREVIDVVRGALQGGARAVQLRDKTASARELTEIGNELRALTRAYEALLFINDRGDVAKAVEADGVHIGPEDVPLSELRAWAGPSLILGYSADDPAVARAAIQAGADYLGCGAVFATSTTDVAGQAIGPQRLDEVARAVQVPVVGIGGITPSNAPAVAATAAAGVAAVSAIMTAPDPQKAAELILAPFRNRPGFGS